MIDSEGILKDRPTLKQDLAKGGHEGHVYVRPFTRPNAVSCVDDDLDVPPSAYLIDDIINDPMGVEMIIQPFSTVDGCPYSVKDVM